MCVFIYLLMISSDIMWEDDKITIEQKYFELLNGSNILLFGIVKDHTEKIRPIFPIVTFILQRLETVIELTSNYKVWDAEIVLRSAMETFVKLVYITIAPIDDRSKRLDEFWNSLAEINSIKMSEQAKKNLQIFGNSEVHKIAYMPLLLPDSLENRLCEKWPRKERQAIEKRWSFTEILNYIATEYKETPWENITALSHGYRMSSHVMHGDETGIQIIEERDNRPEDARDKAYRGHILRLYSDCLVFTIQTGALTMKYLGFNKEQSLFFDIMKEIKSIEKLEAKYKDKIFEESYYDKYR